MKKQKSHPLSTARLAPSAAMVLLIACATGCTAPHYATGLDRIMEQEGRKNGGEYRYRCTKGAHRGASEDFLENTMAALKAAESDSEYAFIEFDVQYSEDGTIVVYHDKRMLRLFGSMKSIGHSTFAELSEITNGEIAAYDEAMDTLTKKLNIEIKSMGDEQKDRQLVDEIVADLRVRKRIKDVLISSISGDVVKYVNETYPDVATGQVFWLTSSTYFHFDRLTQKLYEDINATQADYLMLHVENLRNIEDLLTLKPAGKTVMFWDFDDNMYVVHKDRGDRLWGDSGLMAFWEAMRYRMSSPSRRTEATPKVERL